MVTLPSQSYPNHGNSSLFYDFLTNSISTSKELFNYLLSKPISYSLPWQFFSIYNLRPAPSTPYQLGSSAQLKNPSGNGVDFIRFPIQPQLFGHYLISFGQIQIFQKSTLTTSTPNPILNRNTVLYSFYFCFYFFLIFF